MSNNQLINLIEGSSILHQEEKDSIINALDIIPPSLQSYIQEQLSEYDKAATLQKQQLTQDLHSFYEEYQNEINSINGLSEHNKKEYLKKGDLLIRALNKLIETL